MDRETKRRIEEYRRSEAGPIENNLIDELVDGELDRQEFLRRAAVFGLGAGTIGMLLRYVGEADLAFGAPMAPGEGRRHAPRRHARLRRRASSRTSSGRQARSASPAFPASTSRSRTSKLRGEAVARDELEAERRPHGLDVPDPQGRQVPQRQDDDGRRRRRELQAVPVAEDVADPRGDPAEPSRARGRRQDRARTRSSSG